MADPNIGRILIKRYQIVGLLGQGSMGRVYEAKDILLGGVQVAIKFLAQTLLNQKMRDRFEREATTCALLGQKSIHIIRVTDYGIDERDGVPFYVMEYLKGESLSEIISRQPITLPRFVNLIRQICLGLQCAHTGILIDGEIRPIIHRDIKPSNILISRDDSFGELAKVLDFGIAKMLQTDGDQTNCFMGTLAYSSPEQMEGRELDGRSDIYSLGVMMFQMLSGKMPLHVDTHSFGGWYKAHRSQPPRSFESVNSNLKVPKVLENLIMSCLAKLPGDRPQTVAEVITELEPLEQRFNEGWKFGRRIKDTLDRVKPVAKPSNSPIADEAFRLLTWPSNMPIAEIVFSKPVPNSKGDLATLWVMLSLPEIKKRLICTRYNQFLFLASPHPMLLWLTVLYNHEHGPRWLPCYLDLKTRSGQQMAYLLGNSGQYQIVFFAQDDPKRVVHVLNSTVAPAQCKMLQDWVTMGQMSPNSNFAGLSKDHLRQALEEIKPKILMKLESIYRDGEDVSEAL